jgi:hypothetical protein
MKKAEFGTGTTHSVACGIVGTQASHRMRAVRRVDRSTTAFAGG